MRYLLLSLLLILAWSVTVAGEKGRKDNSCSDPETNRQWEQALTAYPQDQLIVKLSTTRTGLCELVKSKQLDLETARFIWEKALTAALLDRAQKEQKQRGLLKLFATF